MWPRMLTNGDSTVVKLLEKVKFSREDGDHIIFTGDLINKGPDSGGVVDLAREIGASSVRGNHEDRILLQRQDIETTNKTNATESKDDADFFSSKEIDERLLARSFSKEQINWLNSWPVILEIGQVPKMGQVVVVHGGLVPGVDLEKQDPFTVMTMRSIDKSTHVPSSDGNGVKWDKVRTFHEITSLHSRCSILIRCRCLTSTNK